MTETGRRLIALTMALAAIAVPALLLRALCVGSACERRAAPRARVPFCSLPADLRSRLVAGFRDGRSPDVLAVTGRDALVAGAEGYDGPGPIWPRVGEDERHRVPLVFAGPGVTGEVPAGATLDRLAPTIARAIGLARPHPEVRSGKAIDEVRVEARPRLALLVAWKGIGSGDLERRPGAWPMLRSLLDQGAGSLDADAASQPLDPTAVLTTIGTGGLPAEHGITGSVVRNDAGAAVAAWSEPAPFSVIAALGDDLDEMNRQEPRVGVVASDPLDRGVIGRDWYVEHDTDDEIVVGSPADGADTALELLASGFGADEVPDLLAVVLEGSIRAMDRATRAIVEVVLAEETTLLVVTSTGSMGASPDPVPADQIARQAEREAGPAVEAVATGGFFLDQDAIGEGRTSEDRVMREVRRAEGPGGERIFADVFPGTAVEFAEFC